MKPKKQMNQSCQFQKVQKHIGKPKKTKKTKTLVRATPWPVTLDKKLVVQVFGLEPILCLCYIMGLFLCKIR